MPDYDRDRYRDRDRDRDGDRQRGGGGPRDDHRDRRNDRDRRGDRGGDRRDRSSPRDRDRDHYRGDRDRDRGGRGRDDRGGRGRDRDRGGDSYKDRDRKRNRSDDSRDFRRGRRSRDDGRRDDRGGRNRSDDRGGRRRSDDRRREEEQPQPAEPAKPKFEIFDYTGADATPTNKQLWEEYFWYIGRNAAIENFPDQFHALDAEKIMQKEKERAEGISRMRAVKPDHLREADEARDAGDHYGGRGGGGGRGRGGGRGGGGFRKTFPPWSKPGDWYCPACGTLVYSYRPACKCGYPKDDQCQVNDALGTQPRANPYGPPGGAAAFAPIGTAGAPATGQDLDGISDISSDSSSSSSSSSSSDDGSASGRS